MKVAIFIVNWNSGGLLAESLASVHRQRRAPDHIVVVDNASDDDSLLRAGHWLRDVELIRLSSNAGFARANNIAARAAKNVDAFALLNPDAVAEPDWLAALIDAAARYPRAGSFASQMRFASEPTMLDGAGDSYHTSGRAWRNGHLTPQIGWPPSDVEVFAPCAAAALYRRDAFERVGGFDEQYFCYFEDVDLGFRLRLHGYSCVYVHQAVVRHVSSGISGYGSDFSLYHAERNIVWTFVKDMPGPLLWLYLPQHLALNIVALLYYPWRGQGTLVIQSKLDALRGLWRVLKQRRLVQRERAVGSLSLRRVFARGLLSPYVRAYAKGGLKNRHHALTHHDQV